jgi:hypothetical protein
LGTSVSVWYWSSAGWIPVILGLLSEKIPWKNLGEKNERLVEFCGSSIDHIVYDGVYRGAIPCIILYRQVWLEPSLVLYIDMNH